MSTPDVPGAPVASGAPSWRPSVVFSDVDGTILDAAHRVTPRTAAAARALSEAGIPLVLVSARMPEALSEIRRGLGSAGPVVCYSGAYVLDAAGAELLSRPIALGCALEVRDFVACDVPDVTCMAYGYHTWVVSDRSDPRVMREERIVGVSSVEGSLEEHFSGRGLHKFLLAGEPAAIERAEREVGAAFPSLAVVRSSPILCEIMDGRASKTEGIRAVCTYLGVDVSGALSIGDGRNDIDMLRAVPESWAMSNAPGEVKDAAAHVTACDNDHDGFAETIFSVLSGR
ncbi:Cof-type HAD-IIB family hydrolase [Olsenella profusa]|uniref:Cof-type HAD-IIB family hydrolase n=1 Tax=Olsenella profusa TaxID=138595 RepID=A0ABS2F226_9ACTN|nr:Cof-type HAD-IIB family hydrolase [Olsenella profusa]MBM6775041.1 Cof-type HAD-IIB family hydrolase [Olsenella profusa]